MRMTYDAYETLEEIAEWWHDTSANELSDRDWTRVDPLLRTGLITLRRDGKFRLSVTGRATLQHSHDEDYDVPELYDLDDDHMIIERTKTWRKRHLLLMVIIVLSLAAVAVKAASTGQYGIAAVAAGITALIIVFVRLRR